MQAPKEMATCRRETRNVSRWEKCKGQIIIYKHISAESLIPCVTAEIKGRSVWYLSSYTTDFNIPKQTNVQLTQC